MTMKSEIDERSDPEVRGHSWRLKDAPRPSEVKLESIFRVAPIGIGFVSDRVIQDVNQRFCEIVGYTRDELIGQNAKLVYPTEEDYEYVGREKYRQIEEAGIGSVETRLKRKDGRIVNAIVSSTPIDGDDMSAGVTFTVLDITEFKKSIQALRDSEKKLNRAQTVARTGSWQLDIERNELVWSAENQRIFGFATDEPMTYEDFLAFVHPADRKYVDGKWKKALQGEPYDIEHRILVGDEIRWVREKAELEFDENGVLSTGFGTTQDITKLKEAEIERRRSERIYEAATDIAQLGIYVWVPSTDTSYWKNQRMYEIFGCTPSDEPLNLESFLDGSIEAEDIPAFKAALDVALRPKEKFHAVCRIYRKNDRQMRWIEIMGRFEFAEDAAGRRLIGVVADITDRKKAEELVSGYREHLEQEVNERTIEIETQYKELEDLNEIIRQLSKKTIDALETERKALSKEIHDGIAGTLAAIKMQLETHLKRSDRCVPEDAMPIEKIIQHLTRAIKDTKNISMQLRSSTLDDFGLEPALEELIRYFKEFYPDIEIISQFDLDDSIPADVQTVLYRVVQEGLNNAGKHSGAANVRIKLEKQPDQIRLAVLDDGAGFNLQQVLSGQDALMGYGIHSMRERVEICDGKFEIFSEPGKGTSVNVWIPADR